MASNVELIVVPVAQGEFTLNVNDVPATARGGAVLLGDGQDQTVALTGMLRDGARTFQFDVLPATGSFGGATLLDHSSAPQPLPVSRRRRRVS